MTQQTTVRPERASKRSDRFICEKRRTTVSVDGCLSSQKPASGELPVYSCRNCPVGRSLAAKFGVPLPAAATPLPPRETAVVEDVPAPAPPRRLPVVRSVEDVPAVPDLTPVPSVAAEGLPEVPDLEVPSAAPAQPRWRVDDADLDLGGRPAVVASPVVAAARAPVTAAVRVLAPDDPVSTAMERLQRSGLLAEAEAVALAHRVTVEAMLGRGLEAGPLAARKALVAHLRDAYRKSYGEIADLLVRDRSGIHYLMKNKGARTGGSRPRTDLARVAEAGAMSAAEKAVH